MTVHRSANDLPAILRTLCADHTLLTDFHTLCDFGGRLAGTAGEREAARWAAERLKAISGSHVAVSEDSFPVWEAVRVSVSRADNGEVLAATPLLGTASTALEGLTAEVVDLALGRPEDFARERHRLAGRIALVRHEYPFMHDHVHRDAKVRLAEESGAAAFLIAFPEAGAGPISGSNGRTGKGDIPALGLSAEAAVRLTDSAGSAVSAKIVCIGRDVTALLATIVATFPGESEETIVVSAHVDGHPLGESAIDNASGLAVAIALARAVASQPAPLRRTVKICLFSAEEWDLGGSRRWLDGMSEAERQRIVLNINLDAVAGDDHFTALTSDFAALPAFLREALRDTNLSLDIFEPFKENSDHANFAADGIPAFRLLAGFNRPQSALRFLLTSKDKRDLVTGDQLATAAVIAGAILDHALGVPTPVLTALRTKRSGVA
jgi:Zn-dependent M28 family amino/carboxypeptidase